MLVLIYLKKSYMQQVELNYAFLIMAHDQANHLKRLINALSHSHHYIFIHIDAKKDIEVFKSLALDNKENIIFLSDKRRVRVNWGGWSVTQATLNLIDEALAHPLEFHRFCLLSGSDYPIKPINHIREVLKSNVEYLRLDRQISNHASETHSYFIERYFFTDYPLLVRLRLSNRFPRKVPISIPLYHGSQWWALTKNSILYCKDYISKNPKFIKFFKYSNCSDEILFSSILKDSPFVKLLSHDFNENDNLPTYEYGVHYINWETPEDYGRSPKNLRYEDIPSLIRSSALFARKFREPISNKCLDEIDKNIRSKNEN